MATTQEATQRTAASMGARGLCASCERRSTCTYSQDGRQPVLQCDEYAPSATAPSLRARASEAPGPEDVGSGPLLGLCRTCAGRDTCTYPRPEGGVWRCEEYK